MLDIKESGSRDFTEDENKFFKARGYEPVGSDKWHKRLRGSSIFGTVGVSLVFKVYSIRLQSLVYGVYMTVEPLHKNERTTIAQTEIKEKLNGVLSRYKHMFSCIHYFKSDESKYDCIDATSLISRSNHKGITDIADTLEKIIAKDLLSEIKKHDPKFNYNKDKSTKPKMLKLAR